MATARTSKLEAINTMLSAIGEAPVNDLSASSATTDVIMAKNILDEVSREMQAQGWHFNREAEVLMVPNAQNQIEVSQSVASFDVEPTNAGGVEYVLRGSKVYDKTNHTYTITKSLKATVVYIFDWEELPQSARNYFMIKAARRFQDRVVGSEKHHTFQEMDEFRAMVAFKSAEADDADYSIFDNYDVARVVDRGSVINRVTT
jgi:hypothetical protein